VCDVRKETKISWSVEYREFCPLLPGCPVGCRDRRDGCPAPPRCGQPKCVKKLVKSERQVDVPIYKGVVRYLCPQCANGGSPEIAGKTLAPAAGIDNPPPPPPIPAPSTPRKP